MTVTFTHPKYGIFQISHAGGKWTAVTEADIAKEVTTLLKLTTPQPSRHESAVDWLANTLPAFVSAGWTFSAEGEDLGGDVVG